MPVSAKLAAAWTSFMFLYVYVDILNFYTPGVVRDILHGKVYTFEITETFSVTALSFLAVPILMIVLSVSLPARPNRIANIVVPLLYVPFTVFNLAGASWVYFYGLGVVLELILLAFIVRSAWTWPRAATTATGASDTGRATAHPSVG